MQSTVNASEGGSNPLNAYFLFILYSFYPINYIAQYAVNNTDLYIAFYNF